MTSWSRYGEGGGYSESNGGSSYSSTSSRHTKKDKRNADLWKDNSGYVDGGSDPYNFKIKDPKKERKKKERKEREAARKKALSKPPATRMSIEERTEQRLKEMRLKREAKLQAAAPPPVPDKYAEKEPEENEYEDEFEDDTQDVPVLLPGTIQQNKRSDHLHDLSMESNASSDLSESDFIPGAHAKKRMAEINARREADRVSEAGANRPAPSESPGNTAISRKLGPMFGPKPSSSDDLGGTGTVRIGSVDVNNTRPQTFSNMADAFRMPISPSRSPKRDESAGPEEDSPDRSGEESGGCATPGCISPSYMVQGNGKCHDCNNHSTTIGTITNASVTSERSESVSNANNNTQREVTDTHVDAESQVLKKLEDTALEQALSAEKRVMQASQDATEALRIARAAEERANAVHENTIMHSAQVAEKEEEAIKRVMQVSQDATEALLLARQAVAEKEAFVRLQKESAEAMAQAAAAREMEQNESFNTRLINIAESVRSDIDEKVKSARKVWADEQLRMSADGPPPPPPAATSKPFPQASRFLTEMGRSTNRDVSPGPPPAPSVLADTTNQIRLKRGVRHSDNAHKIASSIREARLEEELDAAQELNETLRATMRRLEQELAKSKESTAHHRQQAVDARLQLQEMKGASALRNSRLRRSLKAEVKKKTEDRKFIRRSTESDPITPPSFEGPSEDELQRLEKEMQEMETLIHGYQKENEKLVSDAKDDKLRHEDAERRWFEEHERLNKIINSLRQQVNDPESALKNTVTARLQNQLEQDAKIARLEEDLQELAHKSKNKEEELKLQLVMSKKALNDLEQELRTQEQIESASEAAAITNLKRRMEQEQRRYEESVSTFKKRLAWYAENQDIIDKNDELVKNQQNQIHTLKKRLVQLEEVARMVARKGGPGTPARNKREEATVVPTAMSTPTRRDPGDVKTIKELKDKLVEVTEALQKRNPNSVAALIQAAGPPEELLAERDSLKMSLKMLKQEIEAQKNDYEKRLRRFRQDHERVKMGLERQIDCGVSGGRSDDTSLKQAPTATNGGEPKKDDSTFRWYQKKIMDMEKKCAARVKAAQRAPTQVSNHENSKKYEHETKELKATLKKETARLEEELRAMSCKLEELNTLRRTEAAEQGAEHDRLKHELENMSRQLKLAKEETKEMATASLKKAELSAPPAPATPIPSLLAPAEEIVTLQRQLSAAEGRNRSLERDLFAAQRAVSSPTVDNVTSEDVAALRDRVHLLEQENAKIIYEAQTEIEAMSNAIKRQAAGVPLTIKNLMQQVNAMESRRRERELELRGAMDTITQRHHAEQTVLKQRMNVALAEKDAQVKKFQRQLGDLMTVVRELKRRELERVGSSSSAEERSLLPVTTGSDGSDVVEDDGALP